MKRRHNPYGYRVESTAPVQRLHPGELRSPEPWPSPEAKADVEVTVADDTDVLLVTQRVQALATMVGFSKPAAAALGTALSEVGTNIVRYAERGTVRMWVQEQDHRPGILIEAVDEGPGIPDVDQALTDGYTTGGTLGGGLGGAKRLVDRFDIDSAADKGTTVRLLKWA